MVERTATEDRTLVVPDHIPARMLNEFAYCERLFALEWRDGLWRDNEHTVSGRVRHETVDEATAPRGEQVAVPGIDGETRALRMSSDALSLVATLDRVIVKGKQAIPVEHKKGSAPGRPVPVPQTQSDIQAEDRPGVSIEGPLAWWPDQVQVVAQALLLETAGFTVPHGVVYYAEQNLRVDVVVTDQLRRAVIETIQLARKIAGREELPPPLIDSPKCIGCSLQPICLPDETQRLLEAPTTCEDDEIRRILPARDEDLPVYVFEQGAKVGKSGETLTITKSSEILSQVPIRQVRQVCLFGNVQITTQAVHALAQAGIALVFLSRGGRFEAITSGMPLFNVLLRKKQFERLAEPQTQLEIARSIVEAKVLNQRVLLLRNGTELPTATGVLLKRHAELAQAASTLDELRGHEGAAAAIYFREFNKMLSESRRAEFAFDFTSRNRRPATDPINSMLSFGYAMLAKEMTATCIAVGLDPLLGALHAPAFKRPALALDLMEEWRPLLVDSVVLTLVNNRMISRKDFYWYGEACELRDAGRKLFLQQWENRLQSLVTHPIFGYRIAYRRALEVQVRLFSRVLTGEIDSYRGFRTR